jgi:DNA repair photolyase
MNRQTVFGVYEWAKYSANSISGCQNNCHYCFGKTAAIKRGIKTKDSWTEEIPLKVKTWTLKDGKVMFPTQHDINENNLEVCLKTIKNILQPGNKILIVSKPNLKCIKRLCNEFVDYKDNILFRFTIGSASNDTLLLWEPNAPSFDERLDALKLAFNENYYTSVSSEPMLDGNISHVIEQVEPYITDAIWLGKMNYPHKRLKTNGSAHMIPHAEQLINIWNDENVKKLYEIYKDHPKIKWKESIKGVVGLEIPTKKGLDI